MPSKIDWHMIRAIRSQEDGFEELVCQLAAKEKAADHVCIWRVGRPDSGKECFWGTKMVR